MTENLPAIIEQTALTNRQPLDQNPAAVYLAHLGSAESRRGMQAALNTIAGLVSEGVDAFNFPWSTLRFQHTTAIRSRLAEKYAPASANKMLCALRGVLKMAYKLDQMNEHDYKKAIDLDPVKGQSQIAGRELSIGEVQSLAQTCKADQTLSGARDAAIIGLLYACGLRRAELVALDLADLDVTDGKLTIRHGKGNKARTVYVTNGALTALQVWIVNRGIQAGPLFCRILRGDHPTSKRLTTQAVYVILKTRAEQAGVKDFSPHDMRRTFVSEMLDRGVDISTVAQLAGHASVTTTARYDRRGEETKRKAANVLHFPF